MSLKDAFLLLITGIMAAIVGVALIVFAFDPDSSGVRGPTIVIVFLCALGSFFAIFRFITFIRTRRPDSTRIQSTEKADNPLTILDEKSEAGQKRKQEMELEHPLESGTIAKTQEERTSQPNPPGSQPKLVSGNIEKQGEDFATEVFAFDLITSDEREEQNWQQMPDLKEIPTLVNTNQIAKAEPLVEAALRRYPEYGFVYYFRAILWEKMGKIDMAKRACEDGLKVSTQKQMLCHRLGLFEFDRGSLHEAVRWWIRSILLQLRSGRMVDTNSFLYLSCVADLIGDKSSAAKLLTLSAGGANGALCLSDAARQKVTERVIEQGDSEITKAIEMLTSRYWTICPECGFPGIAHMEERAYHITISGAFAEYSCPGCKKTLTFQFEYRDKATGTQVLCGSCRTVAYVPPSVWCKTCGKGLSNGWQKQISTGREADKAERQFNDPGVKHSRALARDLMTAHGKLKIIHFTSPAQDYEIHFDFADGKRISSGANAGDIVGFAFGYCGGGPNRLQIFFDEMGLSISEDEIATIKPGTTMVVEGRSLRLAKAGE
jgi:hypothetical protein